MKPPHSRRPGPGGAGSSSGPGDRPPGGNRPRSYVPRGDGPKGDGPRSEPSRADRPRGDGPKGDGPRAPGPKGFGNRSGGPRPGTPRPGTPRPGTPRPGTPHPDSPRAPGGERAAASGPRARRDSDSPERGQDRPRGERTLSIRPPSDAPRRDDERPRPSRFTAAPRRSAAPPADPDAPRGALWLYGTHAVAAALANPARRLRRLLLTEDAEAALTERVAQPWPLAAERVDRPRLDQLLGRDMVHQGAALLADPLTPPTLSSVLERHGPVLVLDQVSDPRNIGAILRTAAAFRVAAVIVQDRNSPEETGTLAKAASGALETVPLLRAVNIARTLVALRAAGCWVIGLDAGGGMLSGPALAQRRVALVLGNEGEGLRRLTRDTCDEIAGIAMPGKGGGLDSLNVSAATAVALYELGRKG